MLGCEAMKPLHEFLALVLLVLAVVSKITGANAGGHANGMSTCQEAKLLALATCLLLCGCAHRQMTKQSVIQIANHVFEKDGHNLADYKRPTVYFDRVFTNGEWVVTYAPLSSDSSHTFWVQVGDKTGTTSVSHCK